MVHSSFYFKRDLIQSFDSSLFENYIFFLSTGRRYSDNSFHDPWLPSLKESIMEFQQQTWAGSYSNPISNPRKRERESKKFCSR